MKFKKLISMAVTAAMVFALAAPAFAFGSGSSSGSGSGSGSGTETSSGSGSETTETAENEIAVTSSVQKPTVKVTVPNSGAVILNPYQMKFKVGSDDHTEIFYSAPIICENKSDCDLKVSASATLKTEGDVVVVGSANDAQTSDPGAKNVWVEMKSGTFADKTATAFKTEDSNLKFTFEQKDKGYGYGAKGEGITIEDKYLEMSYSEDATYFGFMLNGSANKNTKAVWTDADKISVTIVLTFIPQAIAANNPRS